MTANFLLLWRHGGLCLALCLASLLAPSSPARAALLSSPAASCDPTIATCAPGGGSKPLCELLGTCPPGGGGGGGGPTCPAPPGGGSPSCGGAGPASVGGGGTGGVSVGGGNPINLLSGNKYQEETDLAPLPGVLGLELKRHYNSLSSYAGLAGAQWATSYETVLYDLGHQVQIVQADGRRITLQRGVGANARLCTSPQPQDGQVRIEGEGAERVFHWRWGDGRTLSFRSVGPMPSKGYPLHSITAATGERVQLAYNPLGDLSSITDPQGRKLVLAYGKPQAGKRALLQSASTPLGQIRYRHDELGRLTHVMHTAAGADKPHLTRLYHYEAAHQAGNVFALTGISVQAPGEHKGAPQRLSTYAYETSGRAILSTKGRPLQKGADGQVLPGTGVEQITLTYVQTATANEGAPDKTGEVQPRPQSLGRVQLTNSLGQTSTLTTAVIGGQLRLIEFTGAGCSTCGPVNRRYAYGTAGQLLRSIALDAQGQPLSAELISHDRWGRLAQRSRQVYSQGKPVGAPQWLQRYEYTDLRYADGSIALGQQPTRITQPSVIAGKTRSTEFEYNDKGQVLRIGERGWSPVNELGQMIPQGVALQRQLEFAYKTERGISVLTQELEPTQRFDPSGAEGQLPAAGQERADMRNAAERQPLAEGQGAAQMSERSAPNRLHVERAREGSVAERELALLSQGDLQAQRLFDDLGRVVAIRNPQQGWRTAVYNARNQLTESHEPTGARQQASWDEAGRIHKLLRFGPGAKTASQTLRWVYQADRLVLASITDKFGERRSRFEHDSAGRLLKEWLDILPAGALQAAMTESVTLGVAYQLDAKGRVLAQVFTDASGAQLQLTRTLSPEGKIQSIHSASALPRWLGGDGAVVTDVQWSQHAGEYFATSIAHADGSIDKFALRAEMAANPQALQEPSAAATAAEVPHQAATQRPGLEHDPSGRPRRFQTAQGLLSLSWNAGGQLEGIQGSQDSSLHIYDAQGRRVARLSQAPARGSRLALYFYEGTRLLAQTDARGRGQLAYAHLGYRPIAQFPMDGKAWHQRLKDWAFGAEVRHIHTDEVGQVLALSGKNKQFDAQRDQPLRYVGQIDDGDDGGLRYHGARFFDPVSRQFISPDPQGAADSVIEVASKERLNLYAYAGGRPDYFFDPDGAARIRYFAITTGANGQAIGTNQGFTQARWAFIVDNIASTPLATNALARLRNEYANNGKGLLFDAGGNFLGGNASTRTWDAGNGTAADFSAHYGAAAISLAEFTIDDMDDAAATRLIASYIPADWATLNEGASCPDRAGLLPPIKFLPGEADIHVTRNVNPAVAGMTGRQANVQRILNCNRASTLAVTYANDEERRRIVKYEAAAELQEGPAPSAIYRDCSRNNGCRSGTAIVVNGNSYYASYGRTQFIAETFLRTLNGMTGTLTAAERRSLRLDQEVRLPNGRMGSIADMLAIAQRRADRAARAFSNYRTRFGSALPLANATAAWNQLTAPQRSAFQSDTGLGRQEFIDMLMYQVEGRARTENEGKNAFGTEAAFRTLDGDGGTAFGDWLRWLYASQDEYNFVSKTFLKSNLDTVTRAPAIAANFVNGEAVGSDAHRNRQRVIEDELARRVAVLHNSGSVVNATSANLTVPGYVQDYVNEFTYSAGRGDWRSLRCSDELGASPGLQMRELRLR